MDHSHAYNQGNRQRVSSYFLLFYLPHHITISEKRKRIFGDFIYCFGPYVIMGYDYITYLIFWALCINGLQFHNFHSLSYLHEETKPPITHFNLKSSNVLIDQHWNPKISNIGMTKFLGPEYDCTHVTDEKSDVYNFGILIMEIVSGKTPIQTYQNEIEVLSTKTLNINTSIS